MNNADCLKQPSAAIISPQLELSDEIIAICAMLEESQTLVRVRDDDIIVMKRRIDDISSKYDDIKQQAVDRDKYVVDLEDSLFDMDRRLRDAEAIIDDKDHIIISLSDSIDRDNHPRKDDTNQKLSSQPVTTHHRHNVDDMDTMIRQLQDQSNIDRRRIEVLDNENKRLKAKLADQDKILVEYEELLHQQQSDIIDMAGKLRARQPSSSISLSSSRPVSRPSSRETSSVRSESKDQGDDKPTATSSQRHRSSHHHHSRSNLSSLYIADPHHNYDDEFVAKHQVDFDSDGADDHDHQALSVRITSPSTYATSRAKILSDRIRSSSHTSFNRPKEPDARSPVNRHTYDGGTYTPTKHTGINQDDHDQVEMMLSGSSTPAVTPPDTISRASITSAASASRRSPLSFGIRSRRVVAPLIAPDTIDFDVS